MHYPVQQPPPGGCFFLIHSLKKETNYSAVLFAKTVPAEICFNKNYRI